MKICVYPGSFDPITYGHIDVIERAAKISDKLVIAVLVNDNKASTFSLDERVRMIKSVIGEKSNIDVECFSGLLVDFAQKINASYIIRGLRAVSDFEYELQMALLNKNLNPEIETLFMMTNIHYSFLSSSIVKELAKNGGEIDDLVPSSIKDTIINRMCSK